MRVTVTGATGRIGTALVGALKERGDEVIALSRDGARARESLGVEAFDWQPTAEPAPAAALSGADAVVHLAAEDVGQRWSPPVKAAIRESRVSGTRNVVAGLRAVADRPRVLVAASSWTYYGSRGDELIDESSAAGDDFLAQTLVQSETEASAASELGTRVVRVRTGLLLDASDDGLIGQLRPIYRLGLGGPLAGGRQWMPWIHLADEIRLVLAALDDSRWEGPVNAVAPEPVRNRDFARLLGRSLHRPAILPVPRRVVDLMYGEMSRLVTSGVRAVPMRARELGFEFRHAELGPVLRDLV